MQIEKFLKEIDMDFEQERGEDTEVPVKAFFMKGKFIPVGQHIPD